GFYALISVNHRIRYSFRFPLEMAAAAAVTRKICGGTAVFVILRETGLMVVVHRSFLPDLL
ncbi:MAG TPA: hypothetical protein VHL11_23120, partial [Phototrophicaceae bacterium]|nr:hypothetical protein [Phototrophicaceae bacterium]